METKQHFIQWNTSEELLEELKLQILKIKNDINEKNWKEFIRWLKEEFDYNNIDDEETKELRRDLDKSDYTIRNILRDLREIQIKYE